MGPIERALEEAWEERIRLALGSWRNLLRLWRLRRRYHWQALDRERLTVETPPGRLPDCPSCTGLCCRAPGLVSLRLPDLARLVDAGLDHAAVAPRPQARREIYARHPELRELERLDSFRRFPVLDQQGGACVFLGQDDRCTIYAQRPLACRRYPFILSRDRQAVRWAGGCPRWRDDGGPADREAVLEELVRHYDQKLRDLAMLELGRAELARLGLWQRLPQAQAGERFARALAGAGR